MEGPLVQSDKRSRNTSMIVVAIKPPMNTLKRVGQLQSNPTTNKCSFLIWGFKFKIIITINLILFY